MGPTPSRVPMAPKGVLDGGSRMPVAPPIGGPNTAARRLRRGRPPPWPPLDLRVFF